MYDCARAPVWLRTEDPVAVVVSPVKNRDEYIRLEGEDVVHKVLHEIDGSDQIMYEVRFADTHTDLVSHRISPRTSGEAVLC